MHTVAIEGLHRPAGAPWGAAIGLVLLIAQGQVDEPATDEWRSYLLSLDGVARVPLHPTEPADGPLRRSLVVLDGIVSLQWRPLRRSSVVPVPPGALVSGRGRAIVVENLRHARRGPSIEVVDLDEQRRVRGSNVVVVSGQVSLDRRWPGGGMIPREHIALGCTGNLRPDCGQARVALIA